MDQIITRVMHPEDVNEVASLAAWCLSREPMAAYLKLTPESLLPASLSITEESARHELTVVAEDSSLERGKRIIGACIGTPFGFKLEQQLPDPITGVLEAIYNKFVAAHPELQTVPDPTTYAFDMTVGAVKEGYERKGILTGLVWDMFRLATKKGFQLGSGTITSLASQQVARKVKLNIPSRVIYSTFEYNGTRPFENLLSPVACELCEIDFKKRAKL